MNALARARAIRLAPHALRWAVALAAFAAYAAAFLPLAARWGPGFLALYMLPLLACGWVFGAWGGAIAGALMLPVNAVLFPVAGIPDWSVVLLRDASPGALASIAVGAGFGYLADLRDRVEQSEARTRALADAALEGLALHEGGRILHVNAAFARLVGGTPTALVGVHLIGLVDPESRAALDGAISGRARGAASVVVHRPKDGAELHLEVAGAPCDYGGRSVRVLAVRDVTERVRLEREAAAQRDAFQRNERLASLGTVVAGVAHEIGNPLGFISANLQIALDDVRARGMGETATSLERALDGTRRLARISDSLKGVARGGARDAGRVDLNDVLREVDALLASGTPPHVRIDVLRHPDPVVVQGSPEDLHQVVLNLAKNAIEAVGARAGRVVIATEVADGRPVLTVVDDGPGMGADVAARVFDPFFTTKPTGTGLGLALVHRILADHGAEVRLRTAPGEGATFTVLFPRRESEA